MTAVESFAEHVMTALPCVLVANDPIAYREALASALAAMYPSLQVVQVTPAELDAAVAACTPLIIICSRPTEMIRRSASPLIVLYPEGMDHAILTIDGRSWTLVAPQFADVLAAVDIALGIADGQRRRGGRPLVPDPAWRLARDLP